MINKIISHMIMCFKQILHRNNALLFSPGHYYCPIHSKEEALQYFDTAGKDFLEGINLNLEQQRLLLEQLSIYYYECPFKDTQEEESRFYYKNNFYSYSDAIFLYLMMRHLKPKRIIEIGSGFSSAAILDVNEKFFNDSIQCTFVDPDLSRMRKVLTSHDLKLSKIYEQRVQDVDVSIFKQLDENDILFIDSSHVSKIGSDLNHILFKVLPSINKGVYVHFHDIFYPFEYPKQWVLEGRAFNEIYLLRAFLMFNQTFQISLFNTQLETIYPEWFKERMPVCLKDPGGSLWLKKVI